MPRGGRRPGAGRKKGYKEQHTLAKEEAREALRLIVQQHMNEMTASQIAAAKGVAYLVLRDKNGRFIQRIDENMDPEKIDKEHQIVQVYLKDPSTPAYTDLMNRALGKPVEHLEAKVDVSVSGVVERLAAARKRLG